VKRIIAKAMQEEGRRKRHRIGREEGYRIGWEEGYRIGYEEGRQAEAIQSRQQILLELMRIRFGEMPEEIVLTVHGTQDVAQLHAWLLRFAVATTMDEVGIVDNPGLTPLANRRGRSQRNFKQTGKMLWKAKSS
jgi:hypothetical protein